MGAETDTDSLAGAETSTYGVEGAETGTDCLAGARSEWASSYLCGNQRQCEPGSLVPPPSRPPP